MLKLLLVLLAVSLTRCYNSGKTINTSWGTVIGEIVSPVADHKNDLPHVAQYLGIPYGDVPVAQERFKMVISSPKWLHTTKDCRTLPPACVQTAMPELSETKAFKHTSAQRFDFVHRMLPKIKTQSEDCLFLNLFVPERPPSSRNAHVPVLVLIHGDDYGWGSGGPFNGTTLAAFGQIIVVTLNYRLGPFGFLGTCETSSCRGNYGMSDIVSALQMLKSILHSFGGNEREITLMGWGSGASIVSLLMASPMSEPNGRLFARAILLDGTALAPWAMSDDPQGYFLSLARELKCPDGHNTTSPLPPNVPIADINHPAENITRVMQRVQPPSFLSAFAPIVDGQFVLTKPSKLFTPFDPLFRNIDLLVGTVTHPAHHLLSNEDIMNGMTKERRQKILRTLTRNLYTHHRTEILAGMINEYTDWGNPKESNRNLRDTVLSILSDALYVAPLIKTLRAHSSDEAQSDSNTFFFHFGHETKSWTAEQKSSGIREGALSGDHVPYILGYPLSRMDREDNLYIGFDAEDRGLSRVMMHYVSNFVKSGDPMKPLPMTRMSAMEEMYAKIPWPQYSQPSREAYLDIGSREKPPAIRNYYRNANVAFWTGLVPQLQGVSAGANEEHDFLPDHTKGDTFFGRVKPFSMANIPFPPPPTTPPPAPIEAFKKSTPRPSAAPEDVSSPTTDVVKANPYATALAITVIVGCGLLMINICILCGIWRSCTKNRRSKKKLQLQYHTYSANHGQNPDLQYSTNSPHSSYGSTRTELVGMPAPPPGICGGGGMAATFPPPPSHYHPPPPTAVPSSNHSHSLIDDSPFPIAGNGILCGSLPRANGRPKGSLSGPSTMGNGHGFQAAEQEPLLSASQKTSIAGIRPGVSPTCPRHGRSAMAAAAAAVAASRGNSLASGAALGGSNSAVDRGALLDHRSLDRASGLPPPPPLEEIQV